jgi:cytochrome P450
MDLFMAGSETTSKSLGFGFLYLLRHPEVQQRAQAEIDAVVGRERLPDLSDKPK